VPLVDRAVAEFCRSCADEHKLDHGGARSATGAKRVLVEAVKDLLPPGVAERPKRGFTLPYAAWLSGPLAPLLRETDPVRALGARGLIDADLASRLLGSSPKALYPRRWALFTLELWSRSF
jgi:asparagine synthase (glutamine-hydrolysing)